MPVLPYLLLLLALGSAAPCAPECSSCFASSPQSCLSCPAPLTLYLSSCQSLTRNSPVFVALTVLLVLVDLVMVVFGFGVYQTGYMYVQMASLMLWGSVEGNPVIVVSGTNLGVVVGNSFVSSFSVQFIGLCIVMGAFGVLLLLLERVPHNYLATLLRRKRVIFPMRIFHYFYPMVLFTSLVSIAAAARSPIIDPYELVLAVLGLILACSLYLGIFYLCNFKKFKLDDPHFYVVTEKIVSTRFWVKNKLFIEATNCTLQIVLFVFGFSSPQQCAIPIIAFQGTYALYALICLPYAKLRYKLVVTASSLLYLGILVCLYLTVTSPSPLTPYTVYQILLMALMLGLVVALLVEGFIMRHTIVRDLRTLRRGQGEGLEKYEERRERVTEFYENEMYGVNLGELRKGIKEGMLDAGHGQQQKAGDVDQ